MKCCIQKINRFTIFFCKRTSLAIQHYSAGREVEIMTIFGISESVLMVLYWHCYFSFFRNTVIE